MREEINSEGVGRKRQVMFRASSTLKTTGFALFLCLLFVANASAQQPALSLADGSVSSSLTADKLLETEPPAMALPAPVIVKRFIEAETRFREQMSQLTFRRDVTLQTIGAAGEVTGEYRRNSQFIMDDHGARIERVLFHPQPTIREMTITKEDIQDLACAQFFGFEMTDLNRYQLSFVGSETINSRETYALDVQPTVTPDPHRMRERYFTGRVWIDAETFQIVKLKGLALPQGKQRFPIFETTREQFAGSNVLLPSSTLADDILHFPKRDVHYRIMVRYYAYRRFGSRVSIMEIDQP